MVNKNTLGLVSIGLRVFSEMILHCRQTPVVTDQIKNTRKGLQNICPDYVKGLSQLYVKPIFQTADDSESRLTFVEQQQILKTL